MFFETQTSMGDILYF